MKENKFEDCISLSQMRRILYTELSNKSKEEQEELCKQFHNAVEEKFNKEIRKNRNILTSDEI